jgi:hypothetical protein
MEDFVTWVDTSKLKRTIMAYNDEVSNPTDGLIILTAFRSLMTTIYYDRPMICRHLIADLNSP